MNSGIQEYPTLATSKKSRKCRPATLSPYHSPALTLALLEKVRALPASIAGFGLKPKKLLGWFDPNTLSLKTAQFSLFEDCSDCLNSLPKSGIMQNGRVYQATSSISSIAEKDFFLLPTPTRQDSKKSVKTEACFGNLIGNRGYSLPVFIRDGPDDGKYPNPELCEVLMTFPASYTDLNAPEMPSYR